MDRIDERKSWNCLDVDTIRGVFPRVQDRRPVGHATRRAANETERTRILARVETLFSFAEAGLLRGNLSPATPAISSSPPLSLFFLPPPPLSFFFSLTAT